MAATKRVQPHREDRPAEEVKDEPHLSPKGEKLKHDLDEILDEIDEMLTENEAIEWTKYTQKGGE